ncbi:hypothetical protein FRC15_011800 [Serendipita sp. 397]|nr:hypothetical protein FRC15_011800 [Serendipita sp. 397]
MGNNLPLPNDIRVARKLIELHRSERSELQTRLTTAQEILEEASEQLEAAGSQGDKVTRSKGSLLSAEATRECAFETRRGLERRLAELEALLERHTSLIHPIRKLPEEILALIMKYTVEAVEYERRTMLHNPLAEVDRRASVELEASSPETCEDTPLSRHDFPPFPARRSNAPLPTPLVLAAVCTHWRNVAYEVPSMWRSITFKLSGQPHAKPQLLRDFVTYTEAPLKHIELRRCDSVVSDFDAGLLRDRVLDALSGLTSPEVFEVWGDVNASALPRLFQTSSESNGRGSIEPGCSTPAQANGQCIVPKDNTPAPCDPSQPSADADHLATPQPDKMSTSSSSPTPSHKMRAKRRTGTSIVKDVLAKIFETIEPTSKRRSLALVATPEGTPRIAVNELSQQDDHDITSSAGPIPRASISSVGTARPFARSLDVSVEGDGDVSVSSNTSDVISSARSIASRSNSTRTSRGIPVPASAIAAAVAAGLIGHHHPLQSIKRLIIHDAASVHVLARRLASEQNIQVIVYG